jgi:twitching motility protein PilU
MSMMERILRLMAEKKASDVYLSANSPALIKINGECVPINSQLLPPDAPRALLAEIVSPQDMEMLQESGELNMAVPLQGVGRFRISAMRQRGSVAVVIRFISQVVPKLKDLRLPPVLDQLILEKRGLILVVGATGSGKSSTLAAMIDCRNEQKTGHILTIEDPIEFQFRNKRSIVNQREVGTDTQSLQLALKNALRQAPDVILIGEIRDRETMSAAISYSQSGHLVLATLHGNNSYHALNRILSFYPVEVRATMLGDLSSSLKSIITQRLLRTPGGHRVPAVEVLLNTKLISEMIDKGDFAGVRESMEKSMAEGSQTFEEDLARLISDGTIDRNEGLANADSPTNLMWRLQNAQQNTALTSRAEAAVSQAPLEMPPLPTFGDFVIDSGTPT